MEEIQVMGLRLRRLPSTELQGYEPRKECEYLDNGACKTCTCDKCQTNGYLIDEARERQKTDPCCSIRECECRKHAQTRLRLRRSGLSTLVERCTFDAYKTDTPWQSAVKERALDYLNVYRNTSFFISGQSGCGKTHICTAIAGEIMRRGDRLLYFQWVRDARSLKQLITEGERYDAELERWLSAPYLYIDDLFKGKITEADVRLGYELINARYNAAKPLIVSSERSLETIRALEDGEAIAGRLYEMSLSGRFCLALSGQEKNLRFQPGGAA